MPPRRRFAIENALLQDLTPPPQSLLHLRGRELVKAVKAPGELGRQRLPFA